MDLRAYFKKIHTIEADIQEPFVVVVSRETSDGGKPGAVSDVARLLAAKLIADEKAVLATPEESAQFRADVQEKWKAHQDEELSELRLARRR